MPRALNANAAAKRVADGDEPWRPWWLTVLLVVGVAAGTMYVLSTGKLLLQVGTGFAAKAVCSGVFVSDRDAADAFRDLPAEVQLLVSYSVFEDSPEHVGVTASAPFGLGLIQATALYSGRFGCRITYDGGRDKGPAYAPRIHVAKREEASELWPTGDVDASVGVDADVLNKVDLIIQQEMAKSQETVQTRAIVVVHRGKIVGEGYGPKITRETRLQGWSMTKSVMHTLVGRLAKLKAVDLHQPLAGHVPEWKDATTDPRANITLNILFQARSGLEFNEQYGAINDPAVMLFTEPDAAAYAAAKPLAHPIGEVWAYSSGTSNIISRLIRQRYFDNDDDYWNFPYKELFSRIGAHTMTIEMDASGTFVASSFSYATARDWARFGLLMLNRGNWHGEQLIDPSWIDYAVTPAPHSGDAYGAHWWLAKNAPVADGVHPWWGWHKTLPTDMFRSSGYNEQHVFILPSHDLVVVRLGHTLGGSKMWDPAGFLNGIIDAVSAGPDQSTTPV